MKIIPKFIENWKYYNDNLIIEDVSIKYGLIYQFGIK